MNSFARDFPIVCVGGSAGGSAAYVQLLKHLPPETGVAIVIVNHARRTSNALHKILPHSTKMPVELITEGLPIQPNRVFIVPAGHDLQVLDGTFRLRPMSKPKGWPNVITIFLLSLCLLYTSSRSHRVSSFEIILGLAAASDPQATISAVL